MARKPAKKKHLTTPQLLRFIKSKKYPVWRIDTFFSKLKYLRNIVLVVFFALLLQVILGIFAVLYNAQIVVASLHQFGSVVLITTSLILVFKNVIVSFKLVNTGFELSSVSINILFNDPK